MVELTEREKRIITIKFIMYGEGHFKKLPESTREKMMKAMLKINGYDYDQREMMQLGQAILDFQSSLLDGGTEYIEKNKDALDNV